jgi:hypothetical protein
MSSHLIRSDLIPIGTGYAILMAALLAGLLAVRRRLRAGRSLDRHTGRRLDRGWPAFTWHVLTDALGGYLLLAGVDVLYYYLVARVGGNFLDSALTGPALLLAVAFPVFLAASLVSQYRWRQRGSSRAGEDAPPDRKQDS